MPLFKVNVILRTTMVVVADDEDHAFDVSIENAREAIDCDRPDPEVSVRGEISRESQLCDGWDVDCVPYGGNGNTRIGEILS